MFDYNKRFWERMFSESDNEEVEPHTTYYMLGIILGLLLGGTAGYFLGCTVPLATLGAGAGMWIGNSFQRKSGKN